MGQDKTSLYIFRTGGALSRTRINRETQLVPPVRKRKGRKIANWKIYRCFIVSQHSWAAPFPGHKWKSIGTYVFLIFLQRGRGPNLKNVHLLYAQIISFYSYYTPSSSNDNNNKRSTTPTTPPVHEQNHLWMNGNGNKIMYIASPWQERIHNISSAAAAPTLYR